MTITAEPRFERGDRVRLLAAPLQIGAIINGPRTLGTDFEYEVFLDGEGAWFNERALETAADRAHPCWVPPDEFMRELALAKLRTPLSDTFYAYQASRTEFEP